VPVAVPVSFPSKLVTATVRIESVGDSIEILIELESPEEALALFGSRDKNLKMLKERFDIDIVARNRILKLQGNRAAVVDAGEVVKKLLAIIRKDRYFTASTLMQMIRERGSTGTTAQYILGFCPKSNGQKQYIDKILLNDVVFCTGPAGTGKTFLAVLMAADGLKRSLVRKIILVRPAVEAGEKLGFLPGDFQAKINPYLRPLYDALNEILDYDTVKQYLEKEIIEIIPLAYMRGRTLNNAFVILDEAQNTTRDQMKMFLTRMGTGSKIVATGDTTQIDLPEGKKPGLIHVHSILQDIEGIAFHAMTVKDIVRHPLVWKIVDAYEKKVKKK
jgi:phosphate starvation-inducible PhoH-like protein